MNSSEVKVSGSRTPAKLGTGLGQNTVREVLGTIFRRKWIVLGISVPIILFGVYGTLTTSDSFTASTQVLIEARSVESPTFRTLSVDMDVFMNTAAQVAQSIPVAKKAAEALIDTISVLKNDPAFETNLETAEDIRDLILLKINCGQVGESNILSINFSHQNPQLALLVVGAMSDAFISYNIESRQHSRATDYYAEQISTVHAEIDSLINERVQVFENAGLSGFRVNNSSGIQQMRHMEYTYYKTRARRIGLENKYNGIIKAIDSNPDYIPTVSSSHNPNLVGAKSVLDEAVMVLSELRISYQDSSRFVRRQADYVEQARTIFGQERMSFINDLKIELDSVIEEEASQVAALETYKEQILSYPKWESQIQGLDMRVNSKEDLLESLQMKLGEVRLTSESDQRISNMTPLNEPSISAAVGGGKKIVFLFISGILGLVLGLVVALLVDAQDHRIFNRRHAEEYLETPVLGAISTGELPWSKS